MDGFLHCLLLEVSLLLDEIRLKFLFDIFVSLDVPFIFIYHDFFTAFAPAWDMLSMWYLFGLYCLFHIKSHGSIYDVGLEKFPGICGNELVSSDVRVRL